jgi:adenosylcobinamide-GDP ribazoletransferase
MSNHDNWVPEWSDLKIAISLLSRIPLHNDTQHLLSRGPNHLWAFPIVGILIGFICCFLVWISVLLQLDNFAIGFLIVTAAAITTGAMHYDGLADTLDGLWGGWSAPQRLEIMKDSHIGVYGVLGLVISAGLQAALYGQIIQQSIWPIIGIMTISRAVMVPVMGFLENSRSSGLSSQVGKPKLQTIILAMTLGVTIALLTGAWAAIAGAVLAACAVGKIAKNKIGGQTGDILGATQQLSEVSALICVAALL